MFWWQKDAFMLHIKGVRMRERRGNENMEDDKKKAKLWWYVQSLTDKGRTVSNIYWYWEERQGKTLLSPGKQPASRTCPPCGSCLGRKRTAAGNAGAPCPQGWTAGGRNDNSHCCRFEENPAILDGQTHCLQLNTTEKIVSHKYMFNWRKMLLKQLVWVSNTNTIFWFSSKCHSYNWKYVIVFIKDEIYCLADKNLGIKNSLDLGLVHTEHIFASKNAQHRGSRDALLRLDAITNK